MEVTEISIKDLLPYIKINHEDCFMGESSSNHGENYIKIYEGLIQSIKAEDNINQIIMEFFIMYFLFKSETSLIIVQAYHLFKGLNFLFY